jgi:hypothetical protein
MKQWAQVNCHVAEGACVYSVLSKIKKGMRSMQRILRFALSVCKFVILPLGVLMLLGAAYLYFDTRAWLGRSVEAQGSVIEMVQIRDRETGSLTFAPLVRFQTADGKTVEFQSTFQSNPPAYTTGQTVTVLYDPSRPNSAAIASLFSIWGPTIILSAVGAVFLAFGIGVLVVGKRLLQAA